MYEGEEYHLGNRNGCIQCCHNFQMKNLQNACPTLPYFEDLTFIHDLPSNHLKLLYTVGVGNYKGKDAFVMVLKI